MREREKERSFHNINIVYFLCCVIGKKGNSPTWRQECCCVRLEGSGVLQVNEIKYSVSVPLDADALLLLDTVAVAAVTSTVTVATAAVVIYFLRYVCGRHRSVMCCIHHEVAAVSRQHSHEGRDDERTSLGNGLWLWQMWRSIYT